MNAKSIAQAYMKALALHEASWDGKGFYKKDWRSCANLAAADPDIAFIVYMASASGFADWHGWATVVLGRKDND